MSLYFELLQQRDVSPTTRHTYYRGIKTFLRFLHSEGFVHQSIRLPRIRCPQTTVRPLTSDQMRKCLRSFDTSKFTGLRNKIAFLLLLDCGLRLSELLGIKLTEINLDEGFVLAHGKGRRDRWVPFGRTTRKLLWSYLKRRHKVAGPEESAVFVTRGGTELTARGLQMVFKRLARKLNLDGTRISPHTLRHTFALSYIENGGDPFSLQRILGHCSQAMTSRYVNMAKSNVKAQHSKFSPGDRL